ncbi:uncharacterized protein [Coffea arabica]|uniref:Late embryogenesis abundant protein At1g64065-like n=1 Tax=Coffea arabica TaxID=13443 RepID=A0A6P6SN91_COFAR|nr:uncharacterized protein LOC113692966 [Coffea arabica]
MIVEFSVKNANIGCYKYRNSTIGFFYQDYVVREEAAVTKGKANMPWTKTFIIPVDFNSINLPGDALGSELRQHTWIPLTCRATLRGKVTLMLIFKKNKVTNMNCTINLSKMTFGQ